MSACNMCSSKDTQILEGFAKTNPDVERGWKGWLGRGHAWVARSGGLGLEIKYHLAVVFVCGGRT
jgi:hypothetical protein